MRLWSIHPQYLDSKGLVALWREALLAQKVLMGKTKGYKNHPQLNRFKEHQRPLNAIGFYLLQVYQEAGRRGYCFDKNKINISKLRINPTIQVTQGQVAFEFKHLSNKLKKRDKEKFLVNRNIRNIEPNALFNIIKGDIEVWEMR